MKNVSRRSLHTRQMLHFSSAAVALIVLFQNCSGGFEIQSGLGGGLSTGSSELADNAALSRFQAAKAVLDSKCVSCHDGTTSSNFKLGADSEFIASGLISPGSLSNSKLIYRLQNYPIANGLQNMPSTGTLSASEYSILTNWVSSMTSTTIANAFTCSATEAPDTLDAKRLSKLQTFNALKGLASRAFGDTDATALLTLVGAWEKIPNDATAPFSTSDTNFSSLHAQSLFGLMDSVATQFVSAANYARFVNTYIGYDKGSCTYTDPATLSTACQDQLTRNFVLRAWGRKIEETVANNNDELSSFRKEFQLASTTKDGVNAMVFKALLAPEFLFHLQIDVQPADGYYRLSSYMIARRLAFALTQAIPDEDLLTLAGQQDLFQEAPFMAALNTLSKKMDASLNGFTREWLKLDSLPGYKNQTDPKFLMITQGFTADDALRSAMADEVVELVSYIAKTNRPARELLTSDISFARNANLMKIYNQTTAAPASVTEANAVRFPAGERSGLLTRAALLFSGSHTENPIHRGNSIRNELFCLSVSAPPSNLVDALVPPTPDGLSTTRQLYHTKTSGTSCIGCHSQINPIGFALSKYNAFGAFQTSEPIFDMNRTYVRNVATDSAAQLLQAIGENRDVQDGIELSSVAADSMQYQKCITQNFYTYVNGLSSLANTTSSCSMRRMNQALADGGTLQDFFKDAVVDTRFRYRKIEK